MKSKNIVDSFIAIMFLVILGFFMYYTRGIIRTEKEPASGTEVFAIRDTIGLPEAGSDFEIKNVERLSSFK
jgi:hypothetical protein